MYTYNAYIKQELCDSIRTYLQFNTTVFVKKSPNRRKYKCSPL